MTITPFPERTPATPANFNSRFTEIDAALLQLGLNVKAYGVVGDGSDESTAISAAIATATSLGAPTFFPYGTFVGKNITVPAGATLNAIPGTATLKLKTLATLDASPILNVTGQGVTIQGLGFDGNKAAQPADGFSDSYDTGGNGLGRAYRAAIKMKDTGSLWAGLTVDRCTFTGTYGACVATNNVAKVRVTNCVADSCNFELAFVYGNTNGASFFAGHQLLNNRITSCGSGHASVNSDAMLLHSPENFIVSGNVVNGVERDGVKCEYPRRGVISGNSFQNSTLGFCGVQLQSTSSHVAISGNQCYNVGLGVQLDMASSAMSATGISITGNTIETTTHATIADGILVTGGSIDTLTITGNTLRDIKRRAIYITPSGTGGCKSLVIGNNNLAAQSAEANGGGIYLYASGGNWTSVRVIGNIVDHGTAASNTGALLIDRSDSSTMAGVAVIGNVYAALNGSNGFRETAAIVTSGVFDANETNAAIALLGVWEVGPSNILTGTSGVFTHPTALAYSASITPRVTNGITQVITVTNNTAFTINVPSVGKGTGKLVKLRISNTSGGAHGTITAAAGYKLKAAMPAIATANHRDFVFEVDGTNYVETFRDTADVPN
jgi:hypothetical protein